VKRAARQVVSRRGRKSGDKFPDEARVQIEVGRSEQRGAYRGGHAKVQVMYRRTVSALQACDQQRRGAEVGEASE